LSSVMTSAGQVVATRRPCRLNLVVAATRRCVIPERSAVTHLTDRDVVDVRKDWWATARRANQAGRAQ